MNKKNQKIETPLDNLINRGYELVQQDGRIAVYGNNNLGVVYDIISDMVLFDFNMNYKIGEKTKRTKFRKDEFDKVYEIGRRK